MHLRGVLRVWLNHFWCLSPWWLLCPWHVSNSCGHHSRANNFQWLLPVRRCSHGILDSFLKLKKKKKQRGVGATIYFSPPLPSPPSKVAVGQRCTFTPGTCAWEQTLNEPIGLNSSLMSDCNEKRREKKFIFCKQGQILGIVPLFWFILRCRPKIQTGFCFLFFNVYVSREQILWNFPLRSACAAGVPT